MKITKIEQEGNVISPHFELKEQLFNFGQYKVIDKTERTKTFLKVIDLCIENNADDEGYKAALDMLLVDKK